MLKITGLWKGKDKEGNWYLSGNLNYSTKIFVFANNYKKEDNHPDYLLYLDSVDKKVGQAQRQKPEYGTPPPEDGPPF